MSAISTDMRVPIQAALADHRRGALEVNGLVLLLILVAVGMGSTSLYYHWKAPGLIERAKHAKENLPVDPGQRLDVWLEYCAPLICQRLEQLRFSAQQPWLVTHQAAVDDAGEVCQVWGVNLAQLSPSMVTREDLTVVVLLGPPALLGTGSLVGDRALQVPKLSAGTAAPDVAPRARMIVEWALSRMIDKLPKDIPGARIEVRLRSSRRESKALRAVHTA